jgi:hypothetical protein
MDAANYVRELNSVVPVEYTMVNPLPDARTDGIIRAMAQAFCSADDQERALARAGLASQSKHVLLVFAWEAASLSVREKSAALVRDGLIALSIENGQLDARDSIVRMAVLFRSAQKLGLDVSRCFSEAAELATDPYLKEAMRDFPSRSSQNRDLGKAFFIRETMTEHGFTYVQGSWPMRRRIWRERLRRLLGPRRIKP